MSLTRLSKSAEKQKLRFSNSGIKNDKLHLHLNQAKQFTNKVNRHFLKQKQQHHILSTASKSYENFNIRKQTKSQAHLVRHHIQNNTANKSQIILKNPQSQYLIDAFESKASRFPELGNLFYQTLQQKLALQARIYELKRLIINEKKLKDKISTRNCKMGNEMERLRANIKRYSQQSRNDQILINSILNNCLELETQLNQLQLDNKNHQEKIHDHYEIVEDFQNKVLESKRLLASETKSLNKLKELQNMAYKSMMNDYMLQNQLKEQKAFILTDIDLDFKKNS